MWAKARESSAAGQAAVRSALPLGPRESADPVVLEVFLEECMTHLRVSASLLFSVTLVLAQGTHQWNGSGGREGGYALGPEYRHPLTLDLPIATAECPTRQ